MAEKRPLYALGGGTDANEWHCRIAMQPRLLVGVHQPPPAQNSLHFPPTHVTNLQKGSSTLAGGDRWQKGVGTAQNNFPPQKKISNRWYCCAVNRI